MPLPVRLGLDNYVHVLMVDTRPFLSQAGQGLGTRLPNSFIVAGSVYRSIAVTIPKWISKYVTVSEYSLFVELLRNSERADVNLHADRGNNSELQ